VGRKGGRTSNGGPAKAKGPDMTQMAMLMAMSRGGGGPVYIPQQAQQQQPIDYERVIGRAVEWISEQAGRLPQEPRIVPPPEYTPPATLTRNPPASEQREFEKTPGGYGVQKGTPVDASDEAGPSSVKYGRPTPAPPYRTNESGRQARSINISPTSGRRRHTRHTVSEADAIAHGEPIINLNLNPILEQAADKPPPLSEIAVTPKKEKGPATPIPPMPPPSVTLQPPSKGRPFTQLPQIPTEEELDKWKGLTKVKLNAAILREKASLRTDNQNAAKSLTNDSKAMGAAHRQKYRRRARRIAVMEDLLQGATNAAASK
jgi:hypothetical protein